MKKIIVIIIVIAAVGFGGYKYFGAKKNRAAVIYKPVAVRTGSILDKVETTGEVAPLNRVEIKPTVAGRVDQLLVEEGARVKKGQILAYMSSTDRVAILDAARAAGEDEKKWEDTYKPTPIISPLNGTIILRNVVPGETVTASTVLYAIADDLIVVASVDETDVGRIRTGQRAEITLDAYPDKKIAGSVFQILYEGTNVSNVITYKVKIRPGSIPSFFKSQMTANIGIITSNRSGVLLVPWNAVQEDKNGRKYVLTQTEPEQIRTPVTTGIVENNDVEIVAGLEEGETVFVKQEGYKPQVAETAKGALFGNMGSKKNTKKAGSSSKQGGPPPM